MVVYRRHPGKALKDSYTPAVLKAQTALAAVSYPLLLLSSAIPSFFPLVLFLWGCVMASSLPFALKSFKKDRTVGFASPLIILLRSGVFAAGSLLGIAGSFAFSRGKAAH